MMHMMQEAVPQAKTILRYDLNYFKTQDAEYRQPIMLLADHVYTACLPATYAQLNAEHFKEWISLAPELILLGCGDQQVFLHPDDQALFTHANISIDTMTTPAACRTFNILVSEQRRAMAILFPIQSATS